MSVFIMLSGSSSPTSSIAAALLTSRQRRHQAVAAALLWRCCSSLTRAAPPIHLLHLHPTPSSSPASSSSSPTTSSTPTTAGYIGPRRFDPQPSSSPSLLASSTWRTSCVQIPVYACPVLATLSRAFVPVVFPGLTNLDRRIVNIVFVRLRMPGAGNTDACLRPRNAPELGKPGTTRRQLCILPSASLLRHHYAHD